jgi:hypothetical protein
MFKVALKTDQSIMFKIDDKHLMLNMRLIINHVSDAKH